MQKRSGNSQHVTGGAVDIQAINCSREQTVDIHYWIIEKYKEYNGGLAIKVANNGKLGFIHLDTRGEVARWTYPA